MTDAPETWWLPPAVRESWRALPARALRVAHAVDAAHAVHPMHAGTPEAALRFTFPEPGLREFESLLSELLAAGERLRRRSLVDVLSPVAAAAERLADPSDPRRARILDLLTPVTGRARAMCAESLDFLLSKMTEDGLRAAVRAAVGDAERLSRAAAWDAGRARRAVGPRLTVHLLAGNTPWAGVESMVAALCARSASLVKVSSREPVLAGLFARTLADVDEELAGALAVLYWPRGSQALEEAAFEDADAVVAFGDNAAVAALAERLAWRVASGRLTFVPRGHRTSVALIGTAARADAGVARRVAGALARDLALEDQEGCLSPQGAYVEAGPARPAGAGAGAGEKIPGAGEKVPMDAFADLVAEELERLEREWPRRPLSVAEAAAVQQARGTAEVRGARVLAPAGSTRWTLVVDPRPLFEPTPLNRYAWLKPVASLEEALAALAPARGLLSAVGVAGLGARAAEWGERIAETLAPGRICAVGEMQRPPAGWNHDGASDLAALLRWVEIEEEGRT